MENGWFQNQAAQTAGWEADPTMEERVRVEEHCAESTLRQDQGSDHGEWRSELSRHAWAGFLLSSVELSMTVEAGD